MVQFCWSKWFSPDDRSYDISMCVIKKQSFESEFVSEGCFRENAKKKRNTRSTAKVYASNLRQRQPIYSEVSVSFGGRKKMVKSSCACSRKTNNEKKRELVAMNTTSWIDRCFLSSTPILQILVRPHEFRRRELFGPLFARPGTICDHWAKACICGA